MYTIKKRIIKTKHFISYINSAIFLSGTGITLDSVKESGSDYKDLYFNSVLTDEQVDSLITETENYTNPTVILDYIAISTDLIQFSDLNWRIIKEYSFPGSEYSKYNDVCFSSYVISGTGNYNFRIWDNTNQVILAEVNNKNNTVQERFHANIEVLPLTSAIFYIQCNVDDVNTIAQVSNIELTLNKV